MENQNHKSDARCQFYRECAFYNNDVFKDEVEINMCGRGQQPYQDKDYIPAIPKNEAFKPVEGYVWPSQPGGPCDAFELFIKSYKIGQVASHIKDAHKILDDFGY